MGQIAAIHDNVGRTYVNQFCVHYYFFFLAARLYKSKSILFIFRLFCRAEPENSIKNNSLINQDSHKK